MAVKQQIRNKKIDDLYHLAYATKEVIMLTEKHVSLFRNGRNQAIRIPREFELEGTEAIIRKEGDKLIIQSVRKKTLKVVLASLSSLEDDLPEIIDPIVTPENIF